MSASPPRASTAALLGSTARATPARRAAKSSTGSNSDELARAEVLELTLFAEKKEWIEDKIRFLSSLPPVEVVAPLPPELAAASRDELKDWWAEHDRIETEVDDYDMGDLARMREFARDKSKQALSPRDTDLIEITLTTLFAVDRLLHLLRQRRRALTLLGYRLQWEAAVAAAWTAHRQILTDLPKHLTGARWAPADVSTLRQSAGESSGPFPPPTMSTSPSRSLARLASTGSSSLAASTRTQLLALQFSSLTTLSRTLSTSLLPSSAAALDKLIDASPTPLPEPFLDEQDRLEADCARAVDGLAAFLAAVHAQRTAADALLATAAALVARASDPSADASALVQLREGEGESDGTPTGLRAALARIPAPTHPLAPDQARANAAVGDALERAVRAAEDALERAEARGHARETAVEVSARARAVRDELSKLLAALGPPPLPEALAAGPSLAPAPDELARAAALGALDGPLREALAGARGVQADATRAVVRAHEAGLPREVRREVRDAAEELGAVVREVEARLAAEARATDERDAARRVLRALAGARTLADEEAMRLEDAAGRARWRPGGGDVAEADDAPGDASVLAKVRAAQDALLASPLARAVSLVAQGRVLPLAEPAEELARTVHTESIARLEPLLRHLDATRAQARAVDAFSDELDEIEGDVARLANEVDALRDCPVEPLDPLAAQLDAVAASLSALSSSGHARIPLLASPAASAPFDLGAQDAAVREFVNERCARAAGAVEDVRTGLREVAHGRDARVWDDELERVEPEVQELEARVGGSEGGDERAALLVRLDNLRTTTLDALSCSLSSLLSHPSATSSLFIGPHAARQARVDHLQARTSAARQALLHAQMEREAQRAALLAALSAQRDALDSIVDAAQCAAADATVAHETLAAKHAALLASPALDDRMEPDVAPLQPLEGFAAQLHERLDESLAALDALREQASPLPAGKHHAAALASALVTGDHARAACDNLAAVVRSSRATADAWPAARAEQLLRRQGDSQPAREESAPQEVEGVPVHSAALEETARADRALDEGEAAGRGALDARFARAREAEGPLRETREALAPVQADGALGTGLGNADAAPARPDETLGAASSAGADLAVCTVSLPTHTEAIDDSAASDGDVEQECPPSPAPILLLPVTPSSPPLLRRSVRSPLPLRDNDDHSDPFLPSHNAHDPFVLASTFDDPPEAVRLRRRMQDATTREWLDSSAVLQLPTVADAQEVGRIIADCRKQLDALAQLPHERLVWTDVDALQDALLRKEEAVARVASLAHFGERVVAADAALSDLLIAIDAATPSVPAPSPEPDCTTELSLSDALVTASEAVTTVRVEAIPLVDDARVERAVGRIEESWSEMLALVEDVRPRATSAASSASSSSLRRSTRSSSRLSGAPSTPARSASRVSSSRSSMREEASSRATSRASTAASVRSPRPPRVTSSTPRRSNDGLLVPQTPRARKSLEADPGATPTSRRRGKSALPVATTPRRTTHPAPKPTPTAAHPFSFDAPGQRDLSRSTSSIPRRSLASAASSRPDSSSSSASTADSLFSPKVQRIPSMRSMRSARRESTVSAQQPHRQTSLASSRASLAPGCSPRPRSTSTRTPRCSSPSTPPSGREAKAEPYRPNMQNTLDREVGSIINALPLHVQVPICIADGRWTDESGVYNIGGRLYFCRILRSKQVMVRVGGGWLSLLQFIISHFGGADGLTISPSTSLSKNLGMNKPRWISADAVRDQLAASTSGASIHDLLASSVSSAGRTDLGSSTSSLALRRSVSGNLASLRRSVSGKAGPPPSPASRTPRAPRAPRPPVPIWRP
ncbi:hypothetical protein JCM3770_004711 [Rhodotorula araucariae]